MENDVEWCGVVWICMLQFVVVGGDRTTCVEFVAEIHDFVYEDLLFEFLLTIFGYKRFVKFTKLFTSGVTSYETIIYMSSHILLSEMTTFSYGLGSWKTYHVKDNQLEEFNYVDHEPGVEGCNKKSLSRTNKFI
uniref:Uncharacterized protein n=1 Tax=Lactuca sativa TaxID=4236 RepID=A0A9R1V3P8_LACSA|nr:hypothetical protein LSAT_V11C600312870 [Lactuca sativa]